MYSASINPFAKGGTQYPLFGKEHPSGIKGQGRFCITSVFLCEPIKEAWTWKTVRRYAPSLYRRYIQKLADSVNQPEVEIIANWMDILNAYCVLQEEGVLKFSLVVERGLQEYVDAVAEFSRMEPDDSLYEELAYRLGGPNGIKRTAIACLNISALEDVMRSPAKGKG